MPGEIEKNVDAVFVDSLDERVIRPCYGFASMVGHLLDIMGDGVGLAIRITICLKNADKTSAYKGQNKRH